MKRLTPLQRKAKQALKFMQAIIDGKAVEFNHWGEWRPVTESHIVEASRLRIVRTAKKKTLRAA